MSARRKIGKATIYITATDRETPDRRWIYEFKLAVGGKVLWTGEHTSQPRGRRTLMPRPGGNQFVPVALDSKEAFDEVARAVVSCGSVFCNDHDPPVEICDAINEATLEALDQNEEYVISRRK